MNGKMTMCEQAGSRPLRGGILTTWCSHLLPLCTGCAMEPPGGSTAWNTVPLCVQDVLASGLAQAPGLSKLPGVTLIWTRSGTPAREKAPHASSSFLHHSHVPLTSNAQMATQEDTLTPTWIAVLCLQQQSWIIPLPLSWGRTNLPNPTWSM